MKTPYFGIKLGLLGGFIGTSFMVLLAYKGTSVQGSFWKQNSTDSHPIINRHNSAIKVVVFDIGNVLLKTSVPKMIWNIGLIDILKYTIWERKDPRNLMVKVHEFIRYWAVKEGCDQVQGNYPTFEGTPLPNPMQAWQKGQITSDEIVRQSLELFKEYEKEHITCSEHEKKLLTRCVQLLANPQTQIRTKARMSEVIEIVKEIRNQVDEQGNRKFKLVILSNMEKEVVPYIKEQFSDVIDLFDDHIFSGEVSMIKPYKEIYDHVIEKHNVDHHECFFIDDLKENITAAHEYGWQVFHLDKKSNAQQLRAALQSHGIVAAR